MMSRTQADRSGASTVSSTETMNEDVQMDDHKLMEDSIQIQDKTQKDDKMEDDDIKIPPLTRTDSIVLNNEMLGDDCSFSSTDISEDEYIPTSSEKDCSDELSEIGSTPSKSRKRHHVRKDPPLRCSSSHEEEESDELRPKRKTRYKRSDKRHTSEKEESSEPRPKDEDHRATPTGISMLEIEETSVTQDEQKSSEQQHGQKRGSGGATSVTQDKRGKSKQKLGAERSSGGETLSQDKQDTSKQQKRQKQGSQGGNSVTRDKRGKSKQQLGGEQSSAGAKKAKRKWSTAEVNAVEKSLMDFIRMGKTPGKKDCERCIANSPQTLAERDWRAVKFYVYNRIVSEQRV